MRSRCSTSGAMAHKPDEQPDAARGPLLRSRLCLPKLSSPPETILLYLITRFPHVPSDEWKSRFERGLVTHDGASLPLDAPYLDGITILYDREAIDEPETLEKETIVFQNSEIVVADKPHGMPVTPAGNYVERCLLYRLQAKTSVVELIPVHRLDRDTAGLVLFSLKPETRARYHELFTTGTIRREYLAVAGLPESDRTQWRVENRIEAGHPWFRQQVVAGPTNAVTDIELLERRESSGLFRLKPETGKKHQLRVHMASIGAPIKGDIYYPELLQDASGLPPLQLLAYRLAFVDPMDGQPHDFHSLRRLECWQ